MIPLGGNHTDRLTRYYMTLANHAKYGTAQHNKGDHG